MLQETIWVLRTSRAIVYLCLLSWCRLQCLYRFLAFSQGVIIFTISWYCLFVAKRCYLFLEKLLWRGYVNNFFCSILVFDDSVVMLLDLYSFSLLYLTLHLEWFEKEQFCFSFLMIHFAAIDSFAFVRVLFMHLLINFLIRRFINISFSFISCFSFVVLFF